MKKKKDAFSVCVTRHVTGSTSSAPSSTLFLIHVPEPVTGKANMRVCF